MKGVFISSGLNTQNGEQNTKSPLNTNPGYFIPFFWVSNALPYVDPWEASSSS